MNFIRKLWQKPAPPPPGLWELALRQGQERAEALERARANPSTLTHYDFAVYKRWAQDARAIQDKMDARRNHAAMRAGWFTP